MTNTKENEEVYPKYSREKLTLLICDCEMPKHVHMSCLVKENAIDPVVHKFCKDCEKEYLIDEEGKHKPQARDIGKAGDERDQR